MTDLLANLASVLFGLLGVFIVMMNGVARVATLRSRRLGLQRRYSTVPLVSLVLFFIAALMSRWAAVPWVPGWALLAAALADVALWELLRHFGLRLLRRDDGASS